MLKSTDFSQFDITILTPEQQQFCDIIPSLWSQHPDERYDELLMVLSQIRDLILQNQDIISFALSRLNTLRNQSPYYEFSQEITNFASSLFSEPSIQESILSNLLTPNLVLQKKQASKYFQDYELFELSKLTQYLASQYSPQTVQINAMVRKIKLSELDWDQSDDDINEWQEVQTYDPYQEKKNELGILAMERLSFTKLQKMLLDLYRMGNCRITNLNQVLLVYPDYLKIKTSIIKKTFHQTNNVNQETVIMLAILAAAAQESKYIINEMVEKYTLMSGDQQKIIEGYQYMPQKLKKISYLYKILSKHPSYLNSKPQIIHQLLKDQDWTRPQLVKAIIILAVVQCSCTLQQILGIQSEITNNIDERISRISGLSQNPNTQHEEQDISFMSDNSHPLTQFTYINDDINSQEDVFQYCDHFLGDSDQEKDQQIFYQLDMSTDKKSTKLSCCEFDWDNNCQSAIKDFFPKLGQKLNKCYKLIKNNDLSKNQTSSQYNNNQFIQSLFIFSQYILGYKHEYYDYQQIKTHLSNSIQGFIRKAIHQPWSIRSIDYQAFDKIQPQDIVVIATTIANAKMFAQLLMGIKPFI